MPDKTIDDVLELVRNQKTVVTSVGTFITNLKQQVIDAAKPNPTQQAAIEAVFADVTENNKELADALVVNTPADPNAP